MANRSYAVQARTRRIAAQPLVLALVVAGGVGAYSFRSLAGPPDLPRAEPAPRIVPPVAQFAPSAARAAPELPVPSFTPAAAASLLPTPVVSPVPASPAAESRRFAAAGQGRVSGLLGYGPGAAPVVETPVELPIVPPVVPVGEPAALAAVPVAAPIVPALAPILPDAVAVPPAEVANPAALVPPVDNALPPAPVVAPVVPAEPPAALVPATEPVAEAAPAAAPLLRHRSIPRQTRAQIAPVRRPVAYAPTAAPVPRAAPAALPELPAYSRYRYADGALQFAMPARIGEVELGTLPLKIGAGDDVSVRLGDLLAKVQSRMDPAVYDRLSASSSASEFVTFSALREAGIDVRYDSANDQIILGKG